MTIGFLTNIISPHQLPLSRELVKLVGYENYLYVYTEPFHEERAKMGWSSAADGVKTAGYDEASRKWLLEADLVYLEERDLDLIEARLKLGKMTCYDSERWFKPIPLFGGKVFLPGVVRMLVSRYRRMVRKFVALSKDPNFRALPQGPWAKADFLRMGVQEDKIVPWGYFVSPSVENRCRFRKVGESLKVLWAGRDIPLKHVRDIEVAVALANENLTTAVQLYPSTSTVTQPITFTKLSGVPMAEVRRAMREHDTFVFASNGQEGWGAVVSEALEEGMNAIGTWECGAPPTLLPKERLYHCGDVEALTRMLEAEYRGKLPPCSIGDWTAAKAAGRMVALCAS